MLSLAGNSVICILFLDFMRFTISTHLGLSSLKWSSAGAFAVPFRILTRKDMRSNKVLCKNLHLLEEKKYDFGTFWGLFQNI